MFTLSKMRQVRAAHTPLQCNFSKSIVHHFNLLSKLLNFFSRLVENPIGLIFHLYYFIKFIEVKIMAFPKREEGQGLVEYALIIVLVAIVVIAVLLVLGPRIQALYGWVILALDGKMGDENYTYEITGHSGFGTSSDGFGGCKLRGNVTVTAKDQNGNSVSGEKVKFAVMYANKVEIFDDKASGSSVSISVNSSNECNSNSALIVTSTNSESVSW